MLRRPRDFLGSFSLLLLRSELRSREPKEKTLERVEVVVVVLCSDDVSLVAVVVVTVVALLSAWDTESDESDLCRARRTRSRIAIVRVFVVLLPTTPAI